MAYEGRAVLLCTHDFALLERVADRVIFLHRGFIVEDQAVEETLTTFASLQDMVFGYLDERG